MPDNDAGAFHGGRTAQARHLLGLLRSARTGEPSLAVISGGPGMGKTALLDMFLSDDAVARQDTTVLRAAGALWEQHVDFGVIRQLLAGAPAGAPPTLPLPGPVVPGAPLPLAAPPSPSPSPTPSH